MQFINVALYPIGDSIMEFDRSVYADFVKENPIFLIGILFSNLTGSFVGGAIARLTHPTVTVLMAGWVGLILMLLDLYNLITVDYPLWFWLLSIIIYIPAAWSGALAVTFFQTKQLEDIQ